MSKNNVMPAGRYWVGDLCYVMGSDWSEFCDLTIPGKTVDEGKFTLKDGTNFAFMCTAYGDGSYQDEQGHRYSVDAGLIGCILVSDVKPGEYNGELGNVIDFPEDFTVSKEDDVIHIGHIAINTGYDDDDMGEDDWNIDGEDEED